MEALKPLGEGVPRNHEESIRERWIDVAETSVNAVVDIQVEHTPTAPYILLNWHDELSNFFTLSSRIGT